MTGVTTGFEMSEGRLVLRCDTEAFERLREVLCREAGVCVPLTIPPTPLRAVSLELVPGARPKPVGWVRNLAAVALAVLMLLGPIGLVTVVRWMMSP